MVPVSYHVCNSVIFCRTYDSFFFLNSAMDGPKPGLRKEEGRAWGQHPHLVKKTTLQKHAQQMKTILPSWKRLGLVYQGVWRVAVKAERKPQCQWPFFRPGKLWTSALGTCEQCTKRGKLHRLQQKCGDLTSPYSGSAKPDGPSQDNCG